MHHCIIVEASDIVALPVWVSCFTEPNTASVGLLYFFLSAFRVLTETVSTVVSVLLVVILQTPQRPNGPGTVNFREQLPKFYTPALKSNKAMTLVTVLILKIGKISRSDGHFTAL